MARPQPIKVRAGQRGGEWTLALPPGWELRLRRVLANVLSDTLPNPHEKGLTPAQREARQHQRRQRMQRAICDFITDLVAAEIVGKEVALSTRSRYGTRIGSLREHVEAIMRDAARR